MEDKAVLFVDTRKLKHSTNPIMKSVKIIEIWFGEHCVGFIKPTETGVKIEDFDGNVIQRIIF